MQSKENELGTRPVGRLLFSLALPAITAQVVNVLYNMVDRMYIGHIPVVGATALTGLGVTLPVILLVSAFATLASMGGAPRASIMMGKGRKEDAERILGNCTMALVVMGVLLTAAILLFGRQALLIFGADQETIGYAWDYLAIYALGTIAVQVALGLNAFITAQGFSRTSMLTVLIGAVLNIILDPVFIFALNMGVRGAALATILSQAVSAVWVVRFLTGKKTHLRIRASYLRISAKVYLPCVALGLSPFIMQFTECVLQLFAPALRRQPGRRRHDDIEQRDAVFPPAPSGAHAGGAAHRQLQLRRGQQGPRARVLPHADRGVHGLFGGAVGAGHADPSAVCRHLHFGPRPAGYDGACPAHLYGRHRPVRHSVGLPADLCGHG